MERPRTPRKTQLINLMGAAGEHRPPESQASTTPAPPEMTLDRLVASYHSILETRAIYYPMTFDFVRELGRGRQGVVFRALRHGARGCVTHHAIKVYDPSIYRSAEEYWTDMGRIASQISLLQDLQSPNLVTRHSYDESGGVGYVQMESIDGLDIRRLLNRQHVQRARARADGTDWERLSRTIFREREGRLSLQPGVVVYILRRVLHGLERLHAANFLHFDLKPGNIMIDRLGSVKIVDFGRAVKAEEPITFLLGSPMYMAPEMHRHEPCRMSADLFSLGLVALEMLRGRTLLEVETLSQSDEKTLLDLKLSVADRLPELLPGDVLENDILVGVIRRLLEPSQEKRFPSARETDIGESGLYLVDKQLVQSGLDSEYTRDLADYLAMLVNPSEGFIEPDEFTSEAGNPKATDTSFQRPSRP